jgi:hypothetical protein
LCWIVGLGGRRADSDCNRLFRCIGSTIFGSKNAGDFRVKIAEERERNSAVVACSLTTTRSSMDAFRSMDAPLPYRLRERLRSTVRKDAKFTPLARSKRSVGVVGRRGALRRLSGWLRVELRSKVDCRRALSTGTSNEVRCVDRRALGNGFRKRHSGFDREGTGAVGVRYARRRNGGCAGKAKLARDAGNDRVASISLSTNRQ